MQRHTPDPWKQKHVFSLLAFSSSPACWYLEIGIERGFRVMESGPLLLAPSGGFQPRCICVQHCLWVCFSTLPGADPLASLWAECRYFITYVLNIHSDGSQIWFTKETWRDLAEKRPLVQTTWAMMSRALSGKENVGCCKSRGHSGWGGTKGWQLFWRLPLAFKPLTPFCLRQVSPRASKPTSNMAKTPLPLLLLHPISTTGRVIKFEPANKSKRGCCLV